MKVVAFDIGIKNLAYCVLEGSEVLAMENVSLLEPVQPILCSSCTARASLRIQQAPYCKRHLPKTHKILPELLKKISFMRLKALLVEQEMQVAKTKEKCLDILHTRFALPFEQPKQTNASHASLEIIHDGIRAFVKGVWPMLSGCTAVLLENQPVLKNPHMKSVQILLFATLREYYLQQGHTPAYHFVHAKKKVQDAPAGDAGYAERKNKSEERVRALFEAGTIRNPTLYAMWNAATKKSDMADAVCMVVDYKPVQTFDEDHMAFK